MKFLPSVVQIPSDAAKEFHVEISKFSNQVQKGLLIRETLGYSVRIRADFTPCCSTCVTERTHLSTFAP